MSSEVRALISRMAVENPTWGAPRIHGELLKLGFHLSETTVSRWLRHIPRIPDPATRWLTFLRNRREVIAAMVPGTGLEPARLSAHGPKPCASANSAIPA